MGLPPTQASTTPSWWHAGVVSLLALTLALAATLSAQAQSPKRVALIVGNAAYESEKPLKNPVNDANAIAAVLRSDLGFTDVKVITNARRRDLVAAVERFGESARGADAALFYFSGHGQQQGKANYLLPVDAKIESPAHVKSEGLDADDVQAALEAASPRVALVILDACRDNPFGPRTRSIAKGLTRPRNPEEGLLIAFATRDGDVAQDGTGNNSPYAQALIAGLRQADKVPIQQMFDDVADHVKRNTGSAQRPTKYGDLKFNVYLINPAITVNNNAAGSSAPVVRTDPDEEAWKAAQSADSVEAYELYLKDFASGRNASAAKIKLAAAKRRETAQAAAIQPTPARVESAPSTSAGPAALIGSVPAVRAAVGDTIKDCEVCPELVVLPKGSFFMGPSANELRMIGGERPQRRITIDRTLAVGRYEVTQGEWQAVMGENPSRFKSCGSRCPVENVSWYDAKDYLRKLNERTKNRYGYRLLSEAEWEYAARAGCAKAFHLGGDCKDQISMHEANFLGVEGESRQKTIAVGSLQAPNRWGLHDMHGNVREWVEDCRGPLSVVPANGTARTGDCTDAPTRLARGGSWDEPTEYLGSGYRAHNPAVIRLPTIGFRVARTVNF